MSFALTPDNKNNKVKNLCKIFYRKYEPRRYNNIQFLALLKEYFFLELSIYLAILLKLYIFLHNIDSRIQIINSHISFLEDGSKL